MRKITVIAALAIAFGSTLAQATELSTMYRGVRPMGMGGAFTAIADDENAVFYNPAGLASVKKTELDLINANGEVSDNIMSLKNDASSLQTGDTVGTTNMLQKYVGKPMHGRFSEFLNLTTTNFEIGAYGQVTADVAVHTPAYPTTNIDMKADAGAIVGLAHTFLDDKLQVGVGGKYIQRRRFVRVLTPADVVNTSNSTSDKLQLSGDDLKTSSKIGIDLGAIYNLDSTDFASSVGLSILNFGDLNFGDYTYTPTGGTQVTVSNKIPMTINLGYAASKQFDMFKATFAADYQDLTNNASDDSDKGKRIHLGAEVKLPYILTLRAGFNQGYMTYGLGINFWIIEVKYAYYQEEIGGYAGQLVDKRQVAQLIIGF